MIKVIGRELQIPQNERKLGFESDNLVETRTFYITDKALFDLSFKLDVAEYGCTVDLDKSIMPDGSGMILTWTVTSGIMQNSGRINVQLRAFDTESSLVWHSEMQTFFVGESVNALKEIENVPLSEFEQVEIKATAAKEEAAIQANLAKEYAQESLSAANSANTKLDEHKADNSNPHEVTASQVGAYATWEMDIALGSKANDYDFYLHKSSKDNPHEVTASQVGAYTKTETRNYVQAVVDALDISNLKPLCADEIDNFDKIAVEQLFFYSQYSSGGERYAHAPFEWGLIISHDFPGYAFLGDCDYKQIGISLSEGSYGKIFERTLVDNTPLKEGDGSYDLANTDWTVASYGKEEIDDKFNNIPNATYSKGEMEFTTDNVTVVSGEPDAAWEGKSFSTRGDYDTPVVYHIAVSGNVDFFGNASGAMYSIEIDGETSIPIDDFGRFSYIGNVKDYIEISVKYASIGFETFIAEKCIDGFMTGEDKALLLELSDSVGDIDAALDELHAYAQGLISGGDA